MDELKTPLWVYRVVAKQENAGGGTILITVGFNERGEVLSGMIGPNDYSGGEDIIGWLRDTSDNNVMLILPTTTIDNQTIPIIWRGAAPTVDQAHDLTYRLTVGRGEDLRYSISALAQNEELTFSIRMLTLGRSPPTVVIAGTGTVTNTVTYDKVI